MLLKDLEVSSVYSFTTHSPAWLGAKIERAKFICKCDVNIARKLAPIDQLYAQVYPSLPHGSLFAPTTEVYYVFQQLNGDTVVFAGQWIIEASIEVINHVSYTITIPNGTEGMRHRIYMALRAVGITDFAITER